MSCIRKQESSLYLFWGKSYILQNLTAAFRTLLPQQKCACSGLWWGCCNIPNPVIKDKAQM